LEFLTEFAQTLSSEREERFWPRHPVVSKLKKENAALRDQQNRRSALAHFISFISYVLIK
jgi:hypothetical protein